MNMFYNVFIYVDDEMKALIHENLGYSWWKVLQHHFLCSWYYIARCVKNKTEANG